MPLTINPNHPPHTDLLRAGMLLTVTGPTQPSGANALISIARGGVTFESDDLSVGKTRTFGPYSLDCNYSVASNGSGATVCQQESVPTISGQGLNDQDRYDAVADAYIAAIEQAQSSAIT